MWNILKYNILKRNAAPGVPLLRARKVHEVEFGPEGYLPAVSSQSLMLHKHEEDGVAAGGELIHMRLTNRSKRRRRQWILIESTEIPYIC